jgi:hypothetical protein
MPSIVTEEILYVSGDRLIITGRVLSTAAVQIEDHGFWISQSEDFSSPLVISLGERTVPGRFVGESKEFRIGQVYYGKSYLVSSGNTTFGNVISFKSLTPTLSDFSPKLGIPGQTMVIEGSNFTTDTKVKIGGRYIELDDFTAESVIRVRIPPLQDEYIVNVSVEGQNNEQTFSEPFEYIIGKYTPLGPSLTDLIFIDNITFQGETHLYFGLGVGFGLVGLYPNFNKIDVNTGTWEDIAFPGIPVAGAFFTQNFMGSGSLNRVKAEDQEIELTSQFMRFEAGQFTSLPPLPFRLYQAVAFTHHDQLFVYGGETSSRSKSQEIYLYDIASEIWTQKENKAPIQIINSRPHFKDNDLHYFMASDGTIWRYNPEEDIWDQRTTYPDKIEPRIISQTLKGKAYLGISQGNRRLWEYDIQNDSWKRKNTFPSNQEALAFGSWVLNDKIYLFVNIRPQISNKSIWLFEPDGF